MFSSFQHSINSSFHHFIIPSFHHIIIPLFHHSITPSFNPSIISWFIISSFHYSIMQSFHNSTIPSFLIPSFHHSIIPTFHDSIIPSFYHSIVPSFYHSIIPPFHYSIITSSYHHKIVISRLSPQFLGFGKNHKCILWEPFVYCFGVISFSFSRNGFCHYKHVPKTPQNTNTGSKNTRNYLNPLCSFLFHHKNLLFVVGLFSKDLWQGLAPV